MAPLQLGYILPTEILEYIRAISKHWGPLVTGVGALVVTTLVEHEWPDHAPWWVWVAIVLGSVLIASFLAWREIHADQKKLQKELDTLKTPAVSIKLHAIDEDIMDRHSQTLFLEVTGIGETYIRPEVFAFPAEPIADGKQTLCMEPGNPILFGVRRGEPHNVAAVSYNITKSAPFLVHLPCKKITSSEYIQGGAFKIKVCAYGGSKEAELEFNFGVTKGTLWAQNIGSTEKIISPIRKLISGDSK